MWIKIEDQLPIYGVPVLVARKRTYADDADTVVAAAIRTHTDSHGDHWDHWKFNYPGSFYPYGHITHWTPLPELPQETKEDA